MIMRTLLFRGWHCLVAALLLGLAPGSRAQGTAFFYQGQLANNGVPAAGIYDFTFGLYVIPTTLGPQLGSTSTNVGVFVTNGLFTARLDFGAVFAGNATWLAIGVRTNGVGAFTPLSPLQPILPVPYAVFANTAGAVSGTVAGSQITGVLAGGTLAGAYPNPVALGNPANLLVGTLGGDGGNITGLNATNLALGTVPLARLTGLTANQLDPVTWQMATNLNGGNAALASNLVGGLTLSNLVLTNSTFFGNGNGLSNLNSVALAAVPAGMRLVPAGAFMMGNVNGDTDIFDATNVTATISAFYLDTDNVTLSLWQSVYFWATNHGYGFAYPGAAEAANHPVEAVDWYDCVKWCNARSQKAGLPPVYYTDAALTKVYTNLEAGVTVYPNWALAGYRLPTEAEWEKAARGGLAGQRFPWGNIINQNLANYFGAPAMYNYDQGPDGYNPIAVNQGGGSLLATVPGGTFAPNGYGLHDMAGQMGQWCWDWYAKPYAGGTDPRGPATGTYRVLRGGFWNAYAAQCRTAFRQTYTPTTAYNDIGFRCALPVFR